MELDSAIKGYASARERLQGKWTSPVALSDLAVKIALYGTYIGDHLGSYKLSYELKRAKTYSEAIKDEMSATASENKARSDNADDHAQIVRLEVVYKSLNNLVSVIQSRLKVLENEQRSNI